MHVFIECGAILLLIRLVGAQCPVSSSGIYSYGNTCQYRCRCQNEVPCSRMDGKCPGECAAGWMGPACQYANIAFNKTTSQSSSYPANLGLDKLNSFAAVDGNSSSCIKTYSLQEPWWSVDLGKTSYIVGLNIITAADGLGRFTIAVSNTSFGNTSARSICYQQTAGNLTGTAVLDITCWRPVIGRYLYVFKPKNSTELKLCEVKIYGGRELAFKKPTTQSSTLRHNTGAKEATDGSSADNTVSQCSMTQVSDEPWWTVDLEKIYKIQRVVIHNRVSPVLQGLLRGFWLWVRKEHGIYGDDAYLYIQQDPLMNRTIEVVLSQPFDGRYIEILLPAKGRQLSLCEVEVYGECLDNVCGVDCSKHCWCNTTVTGNISQSSVCPYGCSSRALVVTSGCETGCDNDHWGANCTRSCGHCANNKPCNVKTGVCEMGCATGFTAPPMCTDGCVRGMYGEGCDLPCGNCIGNTTCDHVTGICESACAPGYQGPMCTEECGNKTWGGNCSNSCGHCSYDLACNTVTGHCRSQCKTGFKEPPLCDAGCMDGYFGPNCEPCGNCQDGSQCDMKTGNCTSCRAGYKPPLCKTMCTGGTFGFHCQNRCGNCLNWEQCNVFTGACPSGCQEGWTDNNCSVAAEVAGAATTDDTNEQRKLMGIVLGTVGGVLLVCLIVFGCLNWMKRRRRSENIASEKLKMKDFYDQHPPHGYDETATKC